MSMESSISAQLVSHIGRFRNDMWDPAVKRRAELCLLDSLGCYSAGRSLKHFAPGATVAKRLLGMSQNESDSGMANSPFVMAYLYGQAANALDYDDTLLGHPGAPIIGAVLAIGAREQLSTDRLLRGIAAGYEAHWILSAAAAPSHERGAQVRSVGVWDTVAASIGVCVALGHDDWMIGRVIGVAVSHSLLPYTAKWYDRPVPSLKNNLGWAAAGAVLSVDLAMAGQTGVTNALDGDTGMWRMAGSDRWDLDQNLWVKPAVSRVGFKYFPVCWHLQEFLKTFSSLLASIAPDDEVVDIVLTGPVEVEKFCQPDISGSADIAFSLPAAFSLLISKVEPGPLWDSVDDQSEALRYRDLFQYQCSASRGISLRTRSGFEFSAAVDVSDRFDLATWGLDERGVVKKHERLTDPVLRAETAAALALGEGGSADGAPHRFYRSIERMTVSSHR